jgi:predicted DNA-binding transcriptional regulator AlpA
LRRRDDAAHFGDSRDRAGCSQVTVMAHQKALPPTLAPRLIGREAAAAYVSVSPTTFDEMVRDGTMPKPRRLSGRRKAWDVRALDAAVDSLPVESNDNDNDNDTWDNVDAA